LIKIENLSLGYSKKTILEKINLTIEKEKITIFLGQNGSGKTTLMSAINGLIKPREGQIFIDKKDISRLNRKEVAKKIATVSQLHQFGFDFTAYEMVLMGRSAHIGYLPEKADREKAEEAMELIGISHLKEQQVNKISGGERQLVMIARAIAQDTGIILLDEPTSYLDLKNQLKILQLIKYINTKKKVTCVITLHDPNQALMCGDQVVMFHQGAIETGESRAMITDEKIFAVYGVNAQVIDVGEDSFVVPNHKFEF
jgi:iron complex transport system ATP-binding protein